MWFGGEIQIFYRRQKHNIFRNDIRLYNILRQKNVHLIGRHKIQLGNDLSFEFNFSKSIATDPVYYQHTKCQKLWWALCPLFAFCNALSGIFDGFALFQKFRISAFYKILFEFWRSHIKFPSSARKVSIFSSTSRLDFS
jgi:hypothetical protein